MNNGVSAKDNSNLKEIRERKSSSKEAASILSF